LLINVEDLKQCTYLKNLRKQTLDVCACIERYLQLKDGVIQIAFETLWKNLGKIIERLKKLVEL
jgi:hypothetical protein